MRAAGLQGRPKRRRLPWDTGVREEQGIAANLLDRQFENVQGRPRMSSCLPMAQRYYALSVSTTCVGGPTLIRATANSEGRTRRPIRYATMGAR
jgi:hypothetical protein